MNISMVKLYTSIVPSFSLEWLTTLSGLPSGMGIELVNGRIFSISRNNTEPYMMGIVTTEQGFEFWDILSALGNRFPSDVPDLMQFYPGYLPFDFSGCNLSYALTFDGLVVKIIGITTDKIYLTYDKRYAKDQVISVGSERVLIEKVISLRNDVVQLSVQRGYGNTIATTHSSGVTTCTSYSTGSVTDKYVVRLPITSFSVNLSLFIHQFSSLETADEGDYNFYINIERTTGTGTKFTVPNSNNKIIFRVLDDPDFV